MADICFSKASCIQEESLCQVKSFECKKKSSGGFLQAIGSILPSSQSKKMKKADYRFQRSASKRKSEVQQIQEECDEDLLQIRCEEGFCLSDQAEDEEDSYLLQQRQNQVQLYKPMAQTKEYSETNYYNCKLLKMENNFNSVFYKEIIQKVDTLYLYPSFMYSTKSLTEALSTLALLDLPFQSKQHGMKPESRGVKIKCASNMLLFYKTTGEVQANMKNDVISAVRYFDQFDRYYKNQQGENIEKELHNLSTDIIIGCQVIVTNLTHTHLNVNVLAEVPKNSIPILTHEYYQSKMLSLASYQTNSFEFFFYFPSEGFNIQSPVYVSFSNSVISQSQMQSLQVISRKQALAQSSEELQSFKEVVEKQNPEIILQWIQQNKIINSDFNFQKIYGYLHDKPFYEKFQSMLEERLLQDQQTQIFAFMHRDMQRIFDFINQQSQIYQDTIAYFETKLIKIKNYQFSKIEEFKPLINARAHQLENQRIQNTSLKLKYEKFLEYLLQKAYIEEDDKLIWCFYLLLQDRINDCQEIASTIKGKNNYIQFQYLLAYLDLCKQDEFLVATEISQKYQNFPLLRWRKLFQQILQNLGQQGVFDVDKEIIVAKEPEIQFTIRNKMLKFTVIKNIENFEISYFPVDLEVLFSRNPFLTQNTEMSLVKPVLTQQIKGIIQQLEIPQELINQNLYIEISYEQKSTQTKKKIGNTYFWSPLQIQIFKQLGQIKVSSNGIPLPKVYIKCFAQLKNTNTNQFYKDGYTDLRGRFDYVSLNTQMIDKVQKFSILVQSDSNGGVVKETEPPTK